MKTRIQFIYPIFIWVMSMLVVGCQKETIDNSSRSEEFKVESVEVDLHSQFDEEGLKALTYEFSESEKTGLPTTLPTQSSSQKISSFIAKVGVTLGEDNTAYTTVTFARKKDSKDFFYQGKMNLPVDPRLPQDASYKVHAVVLSYDVADKGKNTTVKVFSEKISGMAILPEHLEMQDQVTDDTQSVQLKMPFYAKTQDWYKVSDFYYDTKAQVRKLKKLKSLKSISFKPMATVLRLRVENATKQNITFTSVKFTNQSGLPFSPDLKILGYGLFSDKWPKAQGVTNVRYKELIYTIPRKSGIFVKANSKSSWFYTLVFMEGVAHHGPNILADQFNSPRPKDIEQKTIVDLIDGSANTPKTYNRVFASSALPTTNFVSMNLRVQEEDPFLVNNPLYWVGEYNVSPIEGTLATTHTTKIWNDDISKPADKPKYSGFYTSKDAREREASLVPAGYHVPTVGEMAAIFPSIRKLKIKDNNHITAQPDYLESYRLLQAIETALYRSASANPEDHERLYNTRNVDDGGLYAIEEAAPDGKNIRTYRSFYYISKEDKDNPMFTTALRFMPDAMGEAPDDDRYISVWRYETVPLKANQYPAWSQLGVVPATGFEGYEQGFALKVTSVIVPREDVDRFFHLGRFNPHTYQGSEVVFFRSPFTNELYDERKTDIVTEYIEEIRRNSQKKGRIVERYFPMGGLRIADSETTAPPGDQTLPHPDEDPKRRVIRSGFTAKYLTKSTSALKALPWGGEYYDFSNPTTRTNAGGVSVWSLHMALPTRAAQPFYREKASGGNGYDDRNQFVGLEIFTEAREKKDMRKGFIRPFKDRR